MADNEIIIEITGKLDAIEKQLEGLEVTAKKQGTAIGAGLVGGITAAVVSKGLDLIGDFAVVLRQGFTTTIEAASEAEKSLTLFNASLAASGNFSLKASQDFQEYAAALQNTLGISDDVIVSNASILASLGKLSGEGLKGATQAAIDFSATGRVSLETAFDLIAKAATGNTAALSRYGITIKDTIPDTEKFAAVMEQLNKNFGGLAAAQVNTFEGATKKLAVNFSDIFEEFGKLITRSPVVIHLINELSGVFSSFAKRISALQSTDLVGGLIKQFISFAQVVAEKVLPPIEFFLHSIKLGFKVLELGVKTTIAVIAQVPLILGEVLGSVLEFSAGIGSVVGFFNEELGDKISEGLSNLGQKIAGSSSSFRESLNLNMVEAADAVAQETARVFDFSFTAGVINTIQKVADIAAAAPAKIVTGFKNNMAIAAPDMYAELLATSQNTWLVLENGFNSLFVKVEANGRFAIDSLKKATDDFQKSVNGAFRNFAVGFAQSFAAVGAALVKGQNVFAAFGKAILGVFARLAIESGTAIFLMGLGTFNPAQAATGLALIALGGALQALAGGGAEGSGIPSSAGGAEPTPVGGGSFGPSPEIQEQRGTQVAVNIQGNVLDRKESGLEIARVIQEHFDNNGTLIAGAAV